MNRDPAVLCSAAHAGAHPLEDPGEDLNEALAQAAGFAVRQGAGALLVLPADLPLVDSTDVDALIAALRPAPAVVVAPDRSGSGTNVLLVSPPDAMPFRFGGESFSGHLAAARDAGIEPVILRRPHLGFDVDTPADLEALRARVGGTAMPGGLPQRRTVFL